MLVTYAAWRRRRRRGTSRRPAAPAGTVDGRPVRRRRTPDAPSRRAAASPTGTTAIEPPPRRHGVYGDIAGAADPADPGRLLLGPLHRHAAHGFHLDALYRALFVRPVLAAAALVRFLDREVVETYVAAPAGSPRLLGTPSAAPRPATCRPTSAHCWPAPWC